MTTLALSQLFPDIAGVASELHVSRIVSDSRQVQPGDVFAAVLNPRAPASEHGLRHAAQALARGAIAVLYEPPVDAGIEVPATAIAVPNLSRRLGDAAHALHGHPSRAMELVGVTGTSGKTSITQLIAQAWSLLGRRVGTIGTLGAGLLGQERATGFTTPQVLDTHALIAELRDAGADSVVMEVSSHALDQGRVDGLKFDYAVFTNLSRDHLDYHRDMDDYARAKALLFDWPGLQVAILNTDDSFGAELATRLDHRVPVISVSAAGAPGADVRATGVTLDAAGLAFTLHAGLEEARVRSPLIGAFNVANLLTVAALLQVEDVKFTQIAEVLPRLLPIAGRMNRLGGDGVLPLVLVDYSHKPDPLQQALESLRGHTRGKLICVFGCGGERDAGKRPLMARIAEAHADVVIVTDDNPRSEDGDAIVREIVAGFERPEAALVQRDRGAAIAQAIAMAGPQDTVLIAGKGHEDYQEVRGVRRPFDDLTTARAALEKRA